MNKPFSRFVCDVCGKEIAPEDAILQWVQAETAEAKKHPFMDELKEIQICCNRKECDRELEDRAKRENLHLQWHHLHHVLDMYGIDFLFTFPLERIIPNQVKEAFLEIERRLAVPYYEEARKYFEYARRDDILDINRFTEGHGTFDQELLKQIIQKYSKEK